MIPSMLEMILNRLKDSNFRIGDIVACRNKITKQNLKNPIWFTRNDPDTNWMTRNPGSFTPQVNTDLNQLDEASKKAIIDDIEADFSKGLKGIKRLPIEAKFGVFMAYRYYNKLLQKLKKTPALEIKSTRIRVPNYKKVELLTRSYVKYQLNLL